MISGYHSPGKVILSVLFAPHCIAESIPGICIVKLCQDRRLILLYCSIKMLRFFVFFVDQIVGKLYGVVFGKLLLEFLQFF